MMGTTWIATLLQDYDNAVAPVASGPTCAREGCKRAVDLPDGIGTVYCGPDCLPAPRPLDAEGLPLPEWKRGLELGRR